VFSAARVGDPVDLITDPRSSRAFLYGCDDGRASLYADFFARAQHNSVRLEEEEELAIVYRRFEMDTYLSTWWMPGTVRSLTTWWLMCMRAPFINWESRVEVASSKNCHVRPGMCGDLKP